MINQGTYVHFDDEVRKSDIFCDKIKSAGSYGSKFLRYIVTIL